MIEMQTGIGTVTVWGSCLISFSISESASYEDKLPLFVVPSSLYRISKEKNEFRIKFNFLFPNKFYACFHLSPFHRRSVDSIFPSVFHGSSVVVRCWDKCDRESTWHKSIWSFWPKYRLKDAYACDNEYRLARRICKKNYSRVYWPILDR